MTLIIRFFWNLKSSPYGVLEVRAAIIFFWARGVNNKRNSTSLSLSNALNKYSNLVFPKGVNDLLISFSCFFCSFLPKFSVAFSISFSLIELAPLALLEKDSFGAASLAYIKAVSK